MNIKNSLISMALLTGLTGTLFAGTVPRPNPPVQAVEADPLLTEKSTTTFTIDFSGLTVTLPEELKGKTTVEVKSGELASISVGSIDFLFSVKNPEGEETRAIKGWIDFRGNKKPCSAEEYLQNVKKAYELHDGFYYTLTEIRNEKFTGYLSKTENFKAGYLKGVNYAVVDDGKGTCYNLSLSTDFEGFTFDEIRKALTPLTIGLEQSIKAYTHRKTKEAQT